MDFKVILKDPKSFLLSSSYFSRMEVMGVGCGLNAHTIYGIVGVWRWWLNIVDKKEPVFTVHFLRYSGRVLSDLADFLFLFCSMNLKRYYVSRGYLSKSVHV